MHRELKANRERRCTHRRLGSLTRKREPEKGTGLGPTDTASRVHREKLT